jgi:oligoribonuclease
MQRKRYTKETKLAWFDLEMTGLIVEDCYILEIAAVITDHKLNIIAESPNIAIHQPLEILENMNPWCLRVHAQNGLIERSYNSKVSTAEAEQMLLEFVSKYIGPLESPICGNSVWQDRRFMIKYMPQLESYFNHQILDLATLRILNLLADDQPDSPEYKVMGNHTALVDILDHIAEFKHLRDKFNIH